MHSNTSNRELMLVKLTYCDALASLIYDMQPLHKVFITIASLTYIVIKSFYIQKPFNLIYFIKK